MEACRSSWSYDVRTFDFIFVTSTAFGGESWREIRNHSVQCLGVKTLFTPPTNNLTGIGYDRHTSVYTRESSYTHTSIMKVSSLITATDRGCLRDTHTYIFALCYLRSHLILIKIRFPKREREREREKICQTCRPRRPDRNLTLESPSLTPPPAPCYLPTVKFKWSAIEVKVHTNHPPLKIRLKSQKSIMMRSVRQAAGVIDFGTTAF